LQDLPFRLRLGIIYLHVQQKTVELCLGQGIGALLFDGILRRHHQKQLGQGIGGGTDGDLSLRHGLQQRRLHLSRRAIDLVGQNQIMKQWPALKLKGPVLGAIDIRAG
jgi:hypothetical protein